MKKNILIVDDSESVRNMIKYALKEAGYNILAGENGKDALKHFDGKAIDLVITDLHMPDLDGIDLTRKIRDLKEYRYIPILLLTTEIKQSMKEKAKSAGATGWIVKPFDNHKLLKVIKRALN